MDSVWARSQLSELTKRAQGRLGCFEKTFWVSGGYVELFEEGELVLVHELDELVGSEDGRDLVDLVDDGLAVEERRLLEDLVSGSYDRGEDAAGCPDVDGEVVVAQLEDDLWRLEVLRADLEGQRVVRQVELGETGEARLPKVNDLEASGLGVEGEVVRLDVSVDQAFGVDLVERLVSGGYLEESVHVVAGVQVAHLGEELFVVDHGDELEHLRQRRLRRRSCGKTRLARPR